MGGRIIDGAAGLPERCMKVGDAPIESNMNSKRIGGLSGRVAWVQPLGRKVMGGSPAPFILGAPKRSGLKALTFIQPGATVSAKSAAAR